jgi:hypothetical protein
VAYENRPNSGVLWQNRKHVDGDKLPSLKGEGLLELPDGSMDKGEPKGRQMA